MRKIDELARRLAEIEAECDRAERRSFAFNLAVVAVTLLLIGSIWLFAETLEGGRFYAPNEQETTP